MWCLFFFSLCNFFLLLPRSNSRVNLDFWIRCATKNKLPSILIEGAVDKLGFFWWWWGPAQFQFELYVLSLTSDGLGREIFCQGMYGNRLKNDIFFSKFRSFLPYFYNECLVKLSFLSSFFGWFNPEIRFQIPDTSLIVCTCRRRIS